MNLAERRRPVAHDRTAARRAPWDGNGGATLGRSKPNQWQGRIIDRPRDRLEGTTERSVVFERPAFKQSPEQLLFQSDTSRRTRPAVPAAACEGVKRAKTKAQGQPQKSSFSSVLSWNVASLRQCREDL